MKLFLQTLYKKVYYKGTKNTKLPKKQFKHKLFAKLINLFEAFDKNKHKNKQIKVLCMFLNKHYVQKYQSK